ncbi:reverse transcriptase, RNA-dependent DNA polymerase, Gag-polypeptide of LTR copia-type [Artemisia annua]|uniref:Reverse transcriptase, RNA-dependent DNA polymerase, Gag-polypeptide of LTR copia-type n=1 Tax=Artemisia annua TaxID=35608 RepID=A0A2U1KVH2_ARTAN|nr:reverse transcriptase, RNA-dependent DNA polymerase, Gag-polypeptide of LTR copia-type [Artemisia annua]
MALGDPSGSGTQSQRPYDDGEDTPVEDGSFPPSHDATENETDTTYLHHEGGQSATYFGVQHWFKGSPNIDNTSSIPTQFINVNEDVQTPVLRRSNRESKTPIRFNDYVLSSRVRYGIEKYVSYAGLNRNNMCFASTLNKSCEPKSTNNGAKSSRQTENGDSIQGDTILTTEANISPYDDVRQQQTEDAKKALLSTI